MKSSVSAIQDRLNVRKNYSASEIEKQKSIKRVFLLDYVLPNQYTDTIGWAINLKDPRRVIKKTLMKEMRMITQHFITKTGYFLVLFITVFTVLFVNGCDESNGEMLARIDALETQINHVEEQFQTMTEKLENLTALSKKNPPTIQSTELAAITAELTEAATQRDTVIAETKELRTEIQQLYTQLEQQVKSTEMLQNRIAALHEPTIPLEEELGNTEQAQSQKPVVGFPENPEPEEDQEVIVIRGRTQN